MECNRIQDRFSAFLEKDLDPLEEREIKEHLASCLTCRRDLEKLDKTIHWLYDLDQADVPENFFSGIQKKIESPKAKNLRNTPSQNKWFSIRSSFKIPVQAAAMLAVVFLAIYLTKMTPEQKPSSQEESLKETTQAAEEKVARVFPKKEEAKGDSISRRTMEHVEKIPVEPDRGREFLPHDSVIPEEKKVQPPAAQKGVVEEELHHLQPSPVEAVHELPLQRSQKEVTVKFTRRDEAVLLLEQLIHRFDGEIVDADETVLLVSLPVDAVDPFEEELRVRSLPSGRVGDSTLRDEFRFGRGSAGSVNAVPGPAKKQEKEKIGSTGESSQRRGDRLIVRIRLLQE